VVKISGRPGRDDVPARIVAAAAAWLPAQRRDWGRAMIVELAQVHGLAGRWRFAAGALRVALFLPSGRGRRVLAVALAGLLASAAMTAAAAAEIPDLAVSAAVLGLLLGGYATFRASRPRPPRRTAPGVMIDGLTLVTVVAAIVSVARIAAAHPAAAADSSHVFAVLFAVALAGYLTFALTASSRTQAAAAERQAQRHALWWALAAALASGAVWTVIDLTTPVKAVGITGYLWPVGAAAVLAASAGAAAVTGSAPAGVRAGLLTAVLIAPMHFAADLTALVQAGHYTLTTSYDVAAFPHSGYPDVASYLLSDAMAGDVLVGLVLYPLVLCLLALTAVTLVGTGVGHGSGTSVTSMLR
jgi:hypothetical protein